ncbi:MAG: serine/threonine-protein kinase [Actinomycetales bacterium]
MSTLSIGAPGDLLNDRYRLVRRIAGGGMGEVWEGRDEVLDRRVALKILLPSIAQDEEFRRRFREEARHTARLQHPGIAGVYDFGEDTHREPPALYLVMELVDGVPLSDLLYAGRLDPLRTMHLVGQAGLALQAAHDAGVIHRDVKPGNLLVRPDDTVKITDFGIARAADTVPITRTGTVLGTASYISPEQASGQPVSPASDVYSLGVVAYEMLAGRKPFTGDNPLVVATAQVQQAPPPLPRRVPTPVAELVMSALAKDPADRPASAGAFGRRALELASTLSGAPAAPTSTTVVMPGDVTGATSSTVWSSSPRERRLSTPRRRRRRLAILAVLGAAIVVLLTLAAIRAIGEATTSPNAAAGGARASSAAAPSSSPSRSTSSSTSTGSRAGTAHVEKSTLMGLSYERAASVVRDLGLHPVRRNTASDRAADTVVDVKPTGDLQPGSDVVLSVATGQHGSEKRKGPDSKHGGDSKDGDD